MSSKVDLSQQLRQAREKREKSPEQVSRALGISTEFIAQLEAGDTSALSDDVYTRGKLRSYAQYVGLSPEYSERLFREGRGESRRLRPLRLDGKVGAPIVTTSLIKQASILLGIAAVIAYIIWQVLLLAGNPQLHVEFPTQDQTIYSREIVITGTTSLGSEVTIDGQPIIVADDGSFSHQVTLDEGTYTFTLVARSSMGRTTTEERTVRVAEAPERTD
ncbi:MAG: helix-turn-helix domain-containing protein [Candidatus Saccharimonadales bacterium]